MNDVFQLILHLEEFLAVLFLLRLVSKKKSQAKTDSKRSHTQSSNTILEMTDTMSVSNVGVTRPNISTVVTQTDTQTEPETPPAESPVGTHSSNPLV